MCGLVVGFRHDSHEASHGRERPYQDHAQSADCDQPDEGARGRAGNAGQPAAQSG